MPRRRRLRLLQWLAVLALPVLLVGGDLRVVTGHWFVRWEYGKARFPADSFGLSTEERIHLAQVCQDYLTGDQDISLLADLRLPGGDPAFNERELRHMVDVQAVYRGVTIAGVAAALLWTGGIAALLVLDHTRDVVSAALLHGSLLTLGLLVAVGVFMALSWGAFFTAFHRLFFEGDSWIFSHSDTLIRLFPIRFWRDVAATIVGLLLVEAVIVGAVGWLWGAQRHTNARPASPRIT